MSNSSIKLTMVWFNLIPRMRDGKSTSESNELITDRLIAVYGNIQTK